MHELVYEHLCLLSVIEFVKSLSVDFDNIRDGNACNFMKYFAEAPNTCNSARFCIKTPNAKHTFFSYMRELYLFNECVDSLFNVWGEHIFHRHLSYSDLSGMYILQMI